MKSTSTTLFYITIIFFSNINLANAQHYTVKGKLVDKQMKSVEFAIASLLKNDSLIVQTYTDSLGIFNIKANSEKYTLLIESFGQEYLNEAIDLNRDIDLGIIKVETSTSLEEVIISVTNKLKLKKEVGKYIVSNISASPLSKNKNTYDFLGTIPFVTNSSDGNSITIKNRKEAKILINGKEVGGKDIALNILKSTPAEDIKEIEIITSPGSKYSANSQNGIINIIIKKKDEGLKGAISLGTNQSYYNSQNINSSFSYSKNNWFISTGFGSNNNRSKLKQNSIYKDYINEQQTQIDNNTTIKNASITPFIRINYDLNQKQTVGVQFNSSFRNNNVENNSQNIYSSLNNSIDSLNQSTIKSKNPNLKNIFLNANYTLKTDSIGSNFELNLYNFSQESNTRITNDLHWTNEMQSILQEPDITANVYSIVADYTQNFKNEDVLKFGGSYNRGKTKNSFFYGNYDGIKYVSDSLRSNEFKYLDNTVAAYVVYQKRIGDNWETEAGLRWENYEGEGMSNNSTTNQKNNYLFPSFSVLFYANDNNEFSLDYRSSIIRPPYSYYNPNTYFTSANSYKRSNPNLLPILSNSIALNYSFFKHYSFDIEYNNARNTFNDFDVVQPTGLIETITDNYGKGYEWYFGFTYNKHFFKERWNFTASLSYIYERSKGIYNGIDLGFDNVEWGLKLKNYVYLNKGKDAILNLSYGYGSSNRSILGEMIAMHTLTFELSKAYKNFNFTLGTYDLLQPDLELKEERIEYGFYKKREYYQTVYFRVGYFFGNKKVKSVYNRQGRMSDRIE